MKTKIEQFLRQFSNDILYMQQLAINRQKHYTLRWHKDRHMYYIGNRVRIFLSKREYDSDIQLDLNTFPNPMTYNPSGNINRGGTILLSYRSYKYEIVFQLGRGRFTYREMSKGSVMAEMLVALSIVMMMVSFTIANSIDYYARTKNIQIRYKAFVLLKRSSFIYV